MPSTSSSTNAIVDLQPFPQMHEAQTRNYRIFVGADVTESELRIRYRLEASSAAEFAKVILPEVKAHSERRNELWKETCFECFIPSVQSDAYLEFNGSPTGDWNWYSFQRYREGMSEFQLAPESQPKQIIHVRNERQFECEWRLPVSGVPFEFNRIGLTAVLKTTEVTTYWAVFHSGEKPDFHLASSFRYSLV